MELPVCSQEGRPHFSLCLSADSPLPVPYKDLDHPRKLPETNRSPREAVLTWIHHLFLHIWPHTRPLSTDPPGTNSIMSSQGLVAEPWHSPSPHLLCLTTTLSLPLLSSLSSLDALCPLTSRLAWSSLPWSWLSESLPTNRSVQQPTERKWRKSHHPDDLAHYHLLLSDFWLISAAKSAFYLSKINPRKLLSLFSSFLTLLPLLPPSLAMTAIYQESKRHQLPYSSRKHLPRPSPLMALPAPALSPLKMFSH